MFESNPEGHDPYNHNPLEDESLKEEGIEAPEEGEDLKNEFDANKELKEGMDEAA